MLTIFITLNAIILALIISFVVLSSVVWHISDIKRRYVTRPKIGARLIWLPIVLGGVIISTLWVGVARQWPICHGALLILALVGAGLTIRNNVRHRVIARQNR